MLEVLVCASHLSLCLESPQPEVLLQPRNFNPHPYQEGVRVSPTAASRLGPVLFPGGGDLTIARQSAGPATLLDTGVDNHPYANVARKHRIKLAGRFSSIAADQVTNATCVNANTQLFSEFNPYIQTTFVCKTDCKGFASIGDTFEILRCWNC